VLGFCRNFEKRDALNKAALGGSAERSHRRTAVQTDFFYPESSKLSPEAVEVTPSDFYIEFIIAHRNLDTVLA
jgi:hypothetical protein